MKTLTVLVFLATVSSAATTPDYLLSLDPGSLIAAAQAVTSPQKVRVVIVDSGVNFAAIGITSQVNQLLSRSWVDNSPCTDQVGHGTELVTIFKTVDPLPNVEFVSLKIIASNGVGGETSTLGSLVAALSYIATWNDGVPTVVNVSLQNYPASTEVANLISSSNAFFAMIAGNFFQPVASYPGFYAHLSANAICAGSFNYESGPFGAAGWISQWPNNTGSNYGDTVEIAGVGTLGTNSWGTSYVAPQVAAIAALLLTVQPDLTPAMIKMLLLQGGTYQANLDWWIGDMTGPFPARSLSASGTLQALQQLQSLQLTSSQPTMITPGTTVTVSTSVDSEWLSRVSSAAPWFQVSSEDGSLLGIMNANIEQGRLQFTAPPVTGSYQLQLVVEGVPFGSQLPVTIEPSAPSFSEHSPPLLPRKLGIEQ